MVATPLAYFGPSVEIYYSQQIKAAKTCHWMRFGTNIFVRRVLSNRCFGCLLYENKYSSVRNSVPN